MNIKNNIEVALLNLISDPYDKDNCFYGHIIAQCEIHIDNNFDAIAAVGFWNDVFHLYINPIQFKFYTLKEQKAILIHEAMHIIFNHISRQKEREPIAWHIAADAAINQYIKNLPDGCIYPETLQQPKEKFVEYYYKSINKCSNTCLNNITTLDSHKLWGKSKKELTENFSNNICQTLIENAIKKNKGHIPHSVSIALEILNTPSQIPWQKILKKILSNSNKYFEPNYKKVNRRFPNRIELPGKQSQYMPTVVCIVDVSESMRNKEISFGLIEIQKICKVLNSKMITIQVDTKVQDISTVDFKNHNFIRKGKGGTELYPAVEYIYDNKIKNDILVFITDGYFSFSKWLKIPKKPMFFLITSKHKLELPSKKAYQFLLTI